jgi:hypothetical protein
LNEPIGSSSTDGWRVGQHAAGSPANHLDGGEVVQVVPGRVVTVGPQVPAIHPGHNVDFGAARGPRDVVRVGLGIDVHDDVRAGARRPPLIGATECDDIALQILPGFGYGTISHVGQLPATRPANPPERARVARPGGLG